MSYSQVVIQSLSAVWNEVLAIENIKVFDIGDGMQVDYPSIMMLLFDEDKRKVIRNSHTRADFMN